ncbi:uncharacterized protein Nmag_1328 [Natrialba magadii ATCC 43099]|uniref:Uncharacterized protein n=1 Tax=Natrialba magadii (strain ATCC 43099 / DSM 3394 / CCM 3739 / CIP 104546 / IAM 13178 / JCM 8861 / NBRC 102185 / NCIMB 2190 / MS3) TaxID=547559 RepID=D3SSW1_NATMM|nr:hypothetical protein [Natrialba magadii]ADD04907.1 uncharacterized protein Nmag_1328 [Natrialba magadii ATCC 43099]ELY23956.1 hypothetical protein C500_19160 [Natrialba magadii ATCC 43099]
MTSTHEHAHSSPGTDTDQISLYVYERESGELVDAIYDARSIAIPNVDDRITFVEAEAEGDFETNAVSYREESTETTYVVEEREITYITVDYDIDGYQQDHALVSEVKLWVRVASNTDGTTQSRQQSDQ